MALVVGLTGGIACGKSTVAELLRAAGATVIDADDLARQVVEPGTKGHARVVSAFGESILDRHGHIDRAALGALVFEDPKQRSTLERILHPLIATASSEAISAALPRARLPVFYDAALLVETGQHRSFPVLVVVACNEENQVQRLMARDGLDRAAALARVRSQLPVADKIAVADHVLHNDGTPEALAGMVDALLQTLDAHEEQTP